MKNNKLTVKINKLAHEVFTFTLNPENTPSWISSIAKEEVNEKPTKIGTVYRNQNQNGKWSEYTVTAYEENKLFIFTSGDGNYSVRYTFTPIDGNATEVEYYEWVNQGELKEPFAIEVLDKLKSLLESLS
ncbi:MAG: SRPBCC family protein [Candidatus Nealsonbacteria bacterium]|nr:SRPBCC family protein [Candidatus Nealsonbacteria bacterium]